MTDALWPTKDLRFSRDAALAVSGALALAHSARLQLPFYPEMTLQTLVVLILGARSEPSSRRRPLRSIFSRGRSASRRSPAMRPGRLV